VREGDRVRAGPGAGRDRQRPADAAAAGAGAELARARAELARARTLRAQLGDAGAGRCGRGGGAGRAGGNRGAGLEARFARLTAPAGGVVLRRLAEPGQTVAAGTPVIVVGEAPSGLVLRLPLTDAQMARVAMGQSATVRLPACRRWRRGSARSPGAPTSAPARSTWTCACRR
jgi:multidrug resistance efflux pump